MTCFRYLDLLLEVNIILDSTDSLDLFNIVATHLAKI